MTLANQISPETCIFQISIKGNNRYFQEFDQRNINAENHVCNNIT